MIALPIFLGADGKSGGSGGGRQREVTRNAETYQVSHNMLVSAADAVERIISSNKEVTELSGYAARVTEMLDVFEEMHAGRYCRGGDGVGGGGSSSSGLTAGAGHVSQGRRIVLERVPVVTPQGDVLVESLSVGIEPGMHVLITGPNGAGKSSLFRIVGGLWPVYGGRVVRPAEEDVFYIPQRPLLVLGTFRDQLIYPDTAAQARARGYTDADLLEILQAARLEHVLEREGGWEAVRPWKDVLSGGEKQRIGLARLFFRQPTFAFLDECTSAVSLDVEDELYRHARDDLGITLLTITHRPSLWKHHDWLLEFDGEGGWTFGRMKEGE